MHVSTWTWTHILVVAAGYWVLLLAGWLIYTTRPATQAKARERDLRSVAEDPATGDVVMVYAHSMHLARAALVFIGPPLLLALGWLLVRG